MIRFEEPKNQIFLGNLETNEKTKILNFRKRPLVRIALRQAKSQFSKFSQNRIKKDFFKFIQWLLE